MRNFRAGKEKDSRWVKILQLVSWCTARKSVDTDDEKDVFLKLVREYHAAGKLIMVHTWGGDSLDWCIEAELIGRAWHLYESKTGI
ncbi:MAG: hypothetical protein ACLRZ6_10310 [Lachnospiraceae bacterium]